MIHQSTRPKRIYFETSVFYGMPQNRIKPLKNIISKKNIRIYDSPTCFLELCMLYKDEPENHKQILASIWKCDEICNKKILPTINFLVKYEIEKYFDRETRYLLREEMDTRSMFISMRKRFIKNPKYREDSNLSREAEKQKEKKKEYVQDINSFWHRLSAEVKDYEKTHNECKSIFSFDDFMESIEWKREILYRLLMRFQVPEKLKALVFGDWLQKKEMFLPTFKLFFKFYSLMVKKYYLDNRKAEVGDFLDLDHIIYVPFVDIFVTEESERNLRGVLFEALEYADLNCKIMNLNELLSQFSN